MDDVNGNTNIIRHRRIVRSLSTDNDSDDVSSDESREEAPSIDSAEEPLNDALKGEGLFVHSTRIEAGRSHVMLFTSEPDQDDLDSGGTDLGSGETLELTSETPSGDPVTISDWMTTPGEIGEDTSLLYDVTMNTTDDVGDYDNVTEGITEYATDYVTEGITEYATDYVTEDISDNVTEYEVIGSSASVIMSETSIIITVIIVIVMLSIIGVIIFVIYRRKQKRAKLTKRNGDCHPTTSEEQSKEMELLNTPRDEHQSPDGSTETTPLNVNIEPEVGEDALTENRT
ncbi:hypothetical protein LSH36_326g05033 [Paralvinella palmiformis]|uniref:Uncharacterized protein n=1 Tax=Paralvinella palmiformis TaxID=53620 RepID=A0AAD9JG62_9ANNE|nr:hypothetical protein LSH36_326g05033 [Paralvinella palmiformis]